MLAAVIALSAALALAQAPLRSYEIHIAERSVPAQQRVLRAAEGERVELRWSADEPLVLHLHGYDIETRVAPGKPAVTALALHPASWRRLTRQRTRSARATTCRCRSTCGSPPRD
jgi:hypothetical protein